MKNRRIVVRVVLVCILLAAVAFFVRDSSDKFMKQSYDPSSATAKKFSEMKRWISPQAEFYFVVDVWKLLERPGLFAALVGLTSGEDSVASEFIQSLVKGGSPVGMLMAVGTMGHGEEKPVIAMVVQGQFDDQAIVLSVQSMQGGRAVKEFRAAEIPQTIFCDDDGSADPFGFAFLDDKNMAVGTRSGIIQLFKDIPPSAAPDVGAADGVFFGTLRIGQRLSEIIPANISKPGEIRFSSPDGKAIDATLPFAEQREAMDARMFLEGIKSLSMMQNEGKRALINFLESISIRSEGTNVYVSGNLFSILSIRPAEDATPPAESQK